MTEQKKQNLEKKLDTIIGLMQTILAIELYKNGLTKEMIGKHLHIAKAKVVEMLKGINKECNHGR